jgi:hypothetical protein
MFLYFNVVIIVIVNMFINIIAISISIIIIVSYLDGVTSSKVAGRDCVQTWSVAINILEKEQ